MCILVFVVVSFQQMKNRQLEIQFWQNMRKKDIHITQVLGTVICSNYIITTTTTILLADTPSYELDDFVGESFTACIPLLTATNTFISGEYTRVLLTGVTRTVSVLYLRPVTFPEFSVPFFFQVTWLLLCNNATKS